MKNLSLIVAIGKNNEIGKDNKLLWHIPNDLKFFKEVTNGKTIVMGGNTFYSLPKVLPNRHHIVLTQDDYNFPDEVETFYDFDDMMNSLKERNEEMFIIGGAMLYNSCINYVDKMYITELDKEYPEADRYFPKFNKNDWNSEVIKEDSYEDINYKHVLYKRKVR